MSEISKIVSIFLKSTDEVKRELYGHVVRRSLMKCFHYEIVRQLKMLDKEDKIYCYLITFTLREDHIKAKYKLIKSKVIQYFQGSALEVIDADIVTELTKSGREHYHVSVSSKKFIIKKTFKNYEKKYGFVDIDKSYCRSREHSMIYINKIGQSVPLCREGNVIRLDHSPLIKTVRKD